MINAINISNVYVLDQDEALEFYVGKLGFEVNTDMNLGPMRWLTVNVPGGEGRQLLLEAPGPPAMDDATAEQVRELVTKGALGAVFLTTDDCRKTYEELRERGVEFTTEPVEHFYGVDCALRDPFGNHIRIAQLVDGPLEAPDPAEFANG